MPPELPPPAVVEPEEPKKKVDHGNSLDKVRNLFQSTGSKAGSSDPRARGLVKDYDTPPISQSSWRVFQSKEDFQRVDDQFKADAIDKETGENILETAKRYWDDPDFAEEQRRKIDELRRKKRGGR